MLMMISVLDRGLLALMSNTSMNRSFAAHLSLQVGLSLFFLGMLKIKRQEQKLAQKRKEPIERG